GRGQGGGGQVQRPVDQRDIAQAADRPGHGHGAALHEGRGGGVRAGHGGPAQELHRPGGGQARPGRQRGGALEDEGGAGRPGEGAAGVGGEGVLPGAEQRAAVVGVDGPVVVERRADRGGAPPGRVAARLDGPVVVHGRGRVVPARAGPEGAVLE